eukprot:2009541-Amphidinium_carterae.1
MQLPDCWAPARVQSAARVRRVVADASWLWELVTQAREVPHAALAVSQPPFFGAGHDVSLFRDAAGAPSFF